MLDGYFDGTRMQAARPEEVAEIARLVEKAGGSGAALLMLYRYVRQAQTSLINRDRLIEELKRQSDRLEDEDLHERVDGDVRGVSIEWIVSRELKRTDGNAVTALRRAIRRNVRLDDELDRLAGLLEAAGNPLRLSGKP
ncbi:hypothetical protein J8I29_06780 [Labrys sp. LIt4]|uniref:Uncharacterized protein n=1 Tax=Labrys okinawensis TaxID=346911 RepID=A0A2S9Q6X3_9HYPH|nr:MULTISPECIES: hypothetical protein [Labrys]MBP0579002.1 hypothetical protein [Labrys sp. LIt4]PRH85101.1 hypothetical protein C5L14_24510 [Labrys okinawensis]